MKTTKAQKAAEEVLQSLEQGTFGQEYPAAMANMRIFKADIALTIGRVFHRPPGRKKRRAA